MLDSAKILLVLKRLISKTGFSILDFHIIKTIMPAISFKSKIVPDIVISVDNPYINAMREILYSMEPVKSILYFSMPIHSSFSSKKVSRITSNPIGIFTENMLLHPKL